MKISTSLFTSVSILSAVAQQSVLSIPATGAVIHAGERLTVQLIRPNSIEGSTEVGLVIALLSCAGTSAGCAPPDARLGIILFNGDFKPALHEIPGEPYQNFTVTVPTGFSSGTAQLSTARFHLIGAGPAPILEFNSVILSAV